jgi:DNA repair protein RAD16
MVDESDLIEAVAMDVSPRKSSQTVQVEIKVKKELRVTRTTRGLLTKLPSFLIALAVRTASQIKKGKYVESDTDDDFGMARAADDSADEDFAEESELSDVQVDTPAPLNDEEDSDEDIYGEQIPIPSTSKPTTPAAKKRKLNSSSATPASAKSKTSTSSSVFSAADSVDTPTSSVTNSIRKTLRGVKRKLETPSVAVEQDEEESEFELEGEEDLGETEEDDGISIAPTASSEDVTLYPASRRRRVRNNSRRDKSPRPILTQWQRTNMALCEHHPELQCIWDELETAPLIEPVAVPQPDGLSLRLLPFQLEGLDWLMKNEKQTRFAGGILADEMGMGKTIQTIALLLAEPRGKPNLVIAPTVALMQWKSEIEVHTNNGLSVCLFYGTNRTITAKEMKEYDVVLTTCIPPSRELV